ncbi:hypothetical protein NUW54_g13692 [Trametes sanguinea]|uniref:Uncharacterized protein n=1 Tax=Trametes sanguinea TaxID=158606 RepID=A0ACC1MKS1_9APHY|nr:hypothetical protein NUW54_g13692 [Trametes sanguinea]
MHMRLLVYISSSIDSDFRTARDASLIPILKSLSAWAHPPRTGSLPTTATPLDLEPHLGRGAVHPKAGIDDAGVVPEDGLVW